MLLTNGAVNKDIKSQKKKKKIADNHFHDILRLFDILPNFLYTISETMRNYYLYTWYIRVASCFAQPLKT